MIRQEKLSQDIDRLISAASELAVAQYRYDQGDLGPIETDLLPDIIKRVEKMRAELKAELKAT